MATNESNKAEPMRIGCNQIGSITLEECEPLHEFAILNSDRLASLLHVLRENHQEIDGGFMSDMLGLANDLAYQVQQAVKLMGGKSVGEVNHA